MDTNTEDNGLSNTSKTILAVMGQMVNDSHAISGALIDNLTNERDELAAELELIREGIGTLYDKPWIPNQDTVLRALYPGYDTIKERAKFNNENR